MLMPMLETQITGSGRSPGERKGNGLQYLAWKTPQTGEPAGLQSMGCKELDTTGLISAVAAAESATELTP